MGKYVIKSAYGYIVDTNGDDLGRTGIIMTGDPNRAKQSDDRYGLAALQLCVAVRDPGLRCKIVRLNESLPIINYNDGRMEHSDQETLFTPGIYPHSGNDD